MKEDDYFEVTAAGGFSSTNVHAYNYCYNFYVDIFKLHIHPKILGVYVVLSKIIFNIT